MRAQAISTMRQQLASIGVGAALSSVFSLLTIGLLFYLNRPLAIVGVLLLIPAVISTIFGVKLLISRSAETLRLESDTNALVVQIVDGLPKLRTANAEVRAFGRANAFALQRRSRFRQQAVSRHMTTFNAAFPAFTTLALFATIIILGRSTISPGTFVAFSAAYAQFVVATMGVTMAIGRLVSLVPVFERTRPILDAHPEVDSSKAPAPMLSGAIELEHVSFRYDADGPLVTDDVTLRVTPGEYIALVGPSGSGKSSIMRLLLGFEQPESGTISYDSCDLDHRHRGRATSDRGRPAVRAAHARLGLLEYRRRPADQRRRRLDGGRNGGSGRRHPRHADGHVHRGRRRRAHLLRGPAPAPIIARALAARPKILFFDEATSALDNTTQRPSATTSADARHPHRHRPPA